MPAILKNLGKFNLIVAFAALVTLALFYSMQLLIMAETGMPTMKERVVFPDIILSEITLEIVRTTPKPEEPELPPEIPTIDPPPITDGPPTTIATGIPETTPVTVDDNFTFGPSDSNAIPIAQIQPQYPSREAGRGVEGFVIVEFDVNEVGAVINPEILVSVPEGAFDRASLRALERWRYQPKIIDGKAVPMRGLQTKFTFSLEE